MTFGTAQFCTSLTATLISMAMSLAGAFVYPWSPENILISP